MLNESGLLGDLELNANYMGQPLCLYGDPAYPLRRHLQAPYRNRHLTLAQQDFNTAMSEKNVHCSFIVAECSYLFVWQQCIRFVSSRSNHLTGLFCMM